ncbi:MAG: hypothetical protein R8K50_01475, partial [Mariprofundus sp.]
MRINFFIDRIGSTIAVAICAAIIVSGCGGSGGTAATGPGISTTTITGSAGDGPVQNGNVSVLDANGNAVTTTPANPTTGAN